MREVAQASQVTCEEVMVLAVTDLDVRWTTRTKAIHTSPLRHRALRDDDHRDDIGWGAWAVRGDEILVTYGTWSEEERDMIIAELELLASTLGLVTLGPELEGSDVWEWTDNQVCLAAMRDSLRRKRAGWGLTPPKTSVMSGMTLLRRSESALALPCAGSQPDLRRNLRRLVCMG